MLGLDQPACFSGLIQTAFSLVSAGMQLLTLGTRPDSPRIWSGFTPHGTVMKSEGGTEVDPGKWIAEIAAKHDPKAFAALFEFYAPRVKAMLMRGGAAPDTAEDIAQEALVMVWRKAAYYDARRASASAWVYTIARNLRVDRLRRDKLAALYAHEAQIEADEPRRPDEPLHTAEQAEIVAAAIRQLPEEQVRVLKLSFFEDRAHGEIAAMLDLPLGTVKSRLRLALARLRNLLGEPQ
jgi:RNA polymerase sigma-70 factor, ECF subfamily